jgi:hypothetical protein
VEKGVPSIVSHMDAFLPFAADRLHHSGGDRYLTIRCY